MYKFAVIRVSMEDCDNRTRRSVDFTSRRAGQTEGPD